MNTVILRSDTLKSLMKVVGGFWEITGQLSVRGAGREDKWGFTPRPEYKEDIIVMSNPRYTIIPGVQTKGLPEKIWDWAAENPGHRPLDVLPRLLGLEPGPYSETWLYETPDGDGPVYGKGILEIPTFIKNSLTREKFLQEMGKVPLPKMVYPKRAQLFWAD